MSVKKFREKWAAKRVEPSPTAKLTSAQRTKRHKRALRKVGN